MAGRQHTIPSLDGLRALAIGLVVLQHGSARFTPSPRPLSLRWFLSGRGADGVEIFFVISGFLITTLLLREHQRYGRISLRDFYVRRTFRILPPLYAYLLFLAVFGIILHLDLHLGTLLTSVFFLRDYSTAPGFWGTEHTWSLAVEEQFYLLWPPLLIGLLYAWRKGRGRRAAAITAAALILASPLLRALQKLYGLRALEHRESYMLHTRLDGLMFGCLLALMIGTPLFERIYAVAARVWWLYPLYFLALHGYLEGQFGAPYLYLLGYTLDSLTIALFMAWAVRNPGHPVGRLLNWKPIAFLGVLSYSLYIWQTFFLQARNPTLLGRYPYNLLGLAAAAIASYYLIERPSLRLRDRFLGGHRQTQEERSPQPVTTA